MKKTYVKLASLFALATIESKAEDTSAKIERLRNNLESQAEILRTTENNPSFKDIEISVRAEMAKTRVELKKLEALQAETEQDRQNPNAKEIRQLKNDLIALDEMLGNVENISSFKDVADSIRDTAAKKAKKLKELQSSSRD